MGGLPGVDGQSGNVGVVAQAQAAQAANGQIGGGHDPAVTAELARAVEHAELGGNPAYSVAETLADPALSQAQKDEFVAGLIEMAGMGNQTTADGIAMSGRAAEAFGEMFENIGDAWSGAHTPELRNAVAGAIERGVDSGRLDASDLHNIVDPARGLGGDGARELLSGIRDGVVLDNLAGSLLNDAKSLGYSGPEATRGVTALTAAADFATLAADLGRSGSANAVIEEIGSPSGTVDASGFTSLTEALVVFSNSDNFGRPEVGRSGFEVLSRLVNSATGTSDPTRQAAVDALFTDLVRSSGVDQFYGNESGLAELGSYFDANLPRLMEADMRAGVSNGPLNGVVQDFARNVLLNSDYAGFQGSGDAVSGQLASFATAASDTSLPAIERQNNLQMMGALMGSLRGASADFISDARFDAETRIGVVRSLTDNITGGIASRGGPAGELVGGGLVDAIWDGFANRAEAAAQEHADSAIGGLVGLGDALGATVAESFDNVSEITSYGLVSDSYFERATQ